MVVVLVVVRSGELTVTTGRDIAATGIQNQRVNEVKDWTVDMAISRIVAFTTQQNVELRVEVFNLLNNFNRGDPVTNLDAGNFGQIIPQAGDPRIMQFGIKYGF